MDAHKSCAGLRILIVGTYPPPFGGIASHLTTLLPGLKARGAEDVAVLSFSSTDAVEQREEFTLYRFNLAHHARRLLNPRHWPLLLRTAWALGRHGVGPKTIVIEAVKTVIIDEIARAHDSTVASFYQANMNLELLVLRDLWKGARSIVLTGFGEIYEPGSTVFMNSHKALFQEMFTIPRAIASSSCHCARSFSTLGITRSIEPVYYGVELNDVTSPELRRSFRESNGIGEKDVVVLFMGRFSREMGLDVLIATAPTLLQANASIRLVIAGGKGDHSAQAHAFAAAHPGRVVVMQDVPFAQQKAIYSAADVLVAPSFDQRACMGMAIKEAMAAALPVIGGAGGGVPEAVVDGETGFLVPVGEHGAVDAKYFVECVLRLAGEAELRQRLGRAGRERAERLFSFEKTNERMAEIFMSARATVVR